MKLRKAWMTTAVMTLLLCCLLAVSASAETVTTVEELQSDHPYGNHENRIWAYTVPGAGALAVTFDSRTETEGQYDYICIQGAESEGWSLYPDEDLAGKTIYIIGDTVRIKLVSDGSAVYWGFAVTDVTPWAGGTCGEGTDWVLTDAGELRISGYGAMDDYAVGGAPWYDMRDSITSVVVVPSVSYIGSNAFTGLTGVEEVYFTWYNNPEFAADSFSGVEAVCYYHPSWMEHAKQNYGGNLTWIMREEFGDGMAWTLDGEGTLTITGEGEMADFDYNSSAPWSSMDERIKKVVVESGITSIGSEAFRDCGSLTSVSLPDTLKLIGQSAFYNCSSLTEINLPEGLETIVGESFTGCTSLTEINLPKGLKELGEYTFENCTALEKIVIPDSVTCLRVNVFEGCTALTSAKVGGGVSYIDSAAFYNCTALTEVILPEGLETIYENVFYNCDGLTAVTIPASVTELGEYAFAECDNLSVVTVKGTVSIGEGAFYKCPREINLRFMGDGASFDKYYAFRDATLRCLYPETWDTAVCDSYGGTAVWIPYGVSGDCGENGYWCLSGAGELVVAGNGAMDNFAPTGAPWYPHREKIRRVSLTDGWTSIGANAFAGCTGLEMILFEGDAPAIAANAFTGVGASCYYYADQTGWEETAGANYGGTLSWGTWTDGGTLNDARWDFFSDGTLLFTGTGGIGGYYIDYYEGTYLPGAPWRSHALAVERVVIGAGIKALYSNGFYGHAALREIILPDGLTVIGERAFQDCTSLTAITIPDSVTDIFEYAFCDSGLTTVKLGSGLKTINARTFSSCAALTEVNIPDSVTYIDDYAFHGCAALEKITIPDSVTSTGYEVFGSCTSLTSVTLGKGLTGLEDYFFEGCTALKGMTIPDNITYIGGYIFSGCTALEEITIPDSVTGMGSGIFYNCTSLTSVKLGSGLTKILGSTFCNCTSLRTVTVPAGVTEIGYGAFENCTGLMTVTVEGTVSLGRYLFENCGRQILMRFLGDAPTKDYYTFDGESARCYYPAGNETWTTSATGYFSGGAIPFTQTGECGEETFWCMTEQGELLIEGYGAVSGFEPEQAPWYPHRDKIKKIWLREGVTSIGENAFRGLSAVKNLDLPATLTTIGANAFGGCTGLSTVFFAGNAPAMAADAFAGVNAECYYHPDETGWPAGALAGYGGTLRWNTITLSGSAGSYAQWILGSDGTFLFCGRGVTDSYTTYSSEAPWKDSRDAIKRVIVEEGITYIGSASFYKCTKLTDVVLPESLWCIDDYAFYGCSSLTAVALPEGLTKLGGSSFNGCIKLAGIELPEGLTTMEFSVFAGCDALVEVTIPAGVTELGTGIFSGCDNLERADVKASVLEIPASMFKGCAKLTTYTIPDSVTTIGQEAFAQCEGMTEINLPEGLTTIGIKAFYRCGKLTGIDLPEGLTTIEANAFFDSGLIHITVPGTVKTIGGDAFNDSNLRSAELQEGVETIGASAFRDCWLLESIVLPDSLTEIGERAFDGCNELRDAVIPAGVTAVGEGAFGFCPNLRDLVFLGAAPEMEAGILDTKGTPCSVHYPAGDESWTDAVKEGMTEGETTPITWSPFKTTGTLENGFKWLLSETGELIVAGNGELPDFGAGSAPWYAHRNKVKSLEIAGAVSAIGANAFEGLTGVKEVTLTAALERVGARAFAGCTALKKVRFTGDTPAIADDAFAGVTADALCRQWRAGWDEQKKGNYGGTLDWKLIVKEGYAYESYAVRYELDSEGVITFFGTGELKGYPDYSTDVKHMVVEEGITSIGDNAFDYFKNLLTVSLPDSVTTIGVEAFYDCTSLRSVTFGSGLKEIGRYAFRDSGLERVVLPEGLTVIGEDAFQNCDALVSVTIPSSVTDMGNKAFYDCDSLTDLTLGDGLTVIGAYAFSGCDSLASLTVPAGVTNMGEYAFAYCAALDDLTLAEGLSVLGTYAFCSCDALGVVTIPGSVAEIGTDAFAGCEALTEVTILPGVKSIGDYAFYYCTALERVRLPEGLETIGESAFGDNEALKAIVIPDSVATIGDWAFDCCNNLSAITFPAGLESLGSGAFYFLKDVWFTGSEEEWDALGFEEVSSAVANAEIHFLNGAAAFLSQPADAGAAVGEKAEFSVVAVGTNLAYQWQYRTSATGTWKNATAAGNKTDLMIVPATEARNGYQYRCRVTSGGKYYYSTPATLSVKLPLTITAQPKNTTAPAGGKATFTVEATGTGLTYQWQYRTSASGDWRDSTDTGSKTKTLTVTATVAKKNYQFRCVITDAFGESKTTEPVSFTIKAVTKPTITVNPKRVTVEPTGKAVFSITAAGEDLAYQWQYRKNSSDSWKSATAAGSKTNTLTLDPAGTTRNGYQYRCKVTNAGGTVYSGYATLVIKTVEKPVITASPKRVTVDSAGKAVFSITAAGEGLSYQWQYRKNSTDSWKSATAAGSKTATLTLDPAGTTRNGYQYRCKVSNGGGTVYSGYATLVIAAKPVITAQPRSVTVGPADSVTFSVTATEATGYQWQYKVPGSTKWLSNSCTAATLTINPAKEFRNGYQYRCKVTGPGGTVYSDAATLTVTTVEPPVILRQPKSQSVSASDAVYFTVRAGGEGLSYQWQYKVKGGTKWYDNSCTAATLTIDPAKAFRDGYQYRCKVSNAGGTVYSDTVTLTVVTGVVITRQPVSVMAAADEIVFFVVEAHGEGLTYQWQYKTPTGSWKNNTWTESIFAIDGPGAWRNGYQYRCVITDANGSTATTEPATLTVK